MALIAVDGATLEYDEAGIGAPAFVFIHGLACDRSAWQAQFQDLSRDHRCVAVNLRGRGASSPVPPFDTTQQADDVAAIIRALSLAPAILVGHSLGGITSLLVNERHPDLVLGIVMGDTPVRERGLGAGRAVEGIRAAGSTEPIAGLVESFWVEETPEEIREYVRAMMLTCPPDIVAGMLENPPDDRMKQLVQLADRKPFMAIWGQTPLGDPAWLRDVAVFLRQEPVVGAGHFFQLEKPAVTNALLRAFLDDVARDPRLQR